MRGSSFDGRGIPIKPLLHRSVYCWRFIHQVNTLMPVNHQVARMSCMRCNPTGPRPHHKRKPRRWGGASLIRLLIWLALSATTMLTALAAVLTALAGLVLSALSRVLGLLAWLMLSAALLLAGLLLATLMLGIAGVLRHGSSPLKPAP
jgi:hypothetical protein